jgi:hypothetical protein
MPRAPTGQVIEREGKHGRVYALRFRAYGKREYETTDCETRAAAETKLRHVLADVERGIWKPRRPVAVEVPAEDPIFWEFARRWYEQKELEVGERRREELLWALNKHLVWFGSYRVSDITQDLVDEYRPRSSAKGRCARTRSTGRCRSWRRSWTGPCAATSSRRTLPVVKGHG